jgi:hypothetical protein
MTVAISNVSAIWIDANAKIGLGFNAVDIGQNTSSRLIRLQANSNTVFDVSTSGVVNANAYFANTVTSNIFKTVVYTVSNLPDPAVIGTGSRSFVSDSNVNTFGARVFTGGTNNVPVFSNGIYWLVG